MLSGRRSTVLLAGLLLWFAAFGVPLAAQDNPDADAAADSQLAGTVRTPDGTPIPGAGLRVVQPSSGKAWITWTDENGTYEFPALPSGHFRIELSQIGFTPATREIDLASGVKTPADLKMEVGTLAAITAPAAGENAVAMAADQPAAKDSASPPAPAGNLSNTSPAAGPSASAATAPGGTRGTGAGGRNGQPQSGSGGGGQGGGRRAFQQVGLNGQNQNSTDNSQGDQTIPEAGGQLGQATSADAVQMIGTVAMAQASSSEFPQAGNGGPGGPDTQMAFGNGGNAIPGQGGPAGPGGFGGPGGPGGPGGGGGRGGGRGDGPRPAGGPQGVGPLWGTQRLARQRVNRVHFNIYDTYGNTALNARPYSLYEANPPKISGWNEQAGINIGGPLKIPHVYDGTDKTFFYINFGGTWSRNPVDGFSTVPTQAERNGDFSADNVQLYNPLSNLTGPRSLLTNAGCFQATPSSPLPAAGTCIPTSMLSPVALSLLNYIPLPNIPSTAIGGQNFNYHLQTNLPGIGNRLNINVTHQISSKLSLQVTYNLANATAHSLSSFPGIEANLFTRGQGVTIGLTQNWTKTFLHTSQFYFTRNRSLSLNEFSYLNNAGATLGCPAQPPASTCGIQGISTQPFDYGLPYLNFTNFTGLNDPIFYLARSQTYRYVDSARWLKSKHTITVGGEIRKLDINRDTDPVPNGSYAFTGLMTSQLTASGTPVNSPVNCQSSAAAGPCIGNDFADFLLGYPADTKVQFGDTATYFRNWGFIGYASDDWHVVPKFTLTYGVRYEAFTPVTEENGRITNLAVNSDFSQAQCVTPIATGGCIAGTTPSLIHGHYNNWAPRVGIAWQPPGKYFSGAHQLTLRAGFSMFYVESYLNTLASEMANQPPFGVASTLTQQTATSMPLSFQTDLSSAVAGTITNTVGVNPNYQVPYAMVWNASAEYTLSRGMFVEAMYTGTRGVHLDELLGFSSVTNGTANATGFTYDTSGAFSNFHALQLRLQKRMSHGLMFMARYTYSKSLDDASTIGGGGQTVIQNNADPRGDYGLSSFNMTHQFLGNFMWDLPFGDRQRFAARGWKKAVFGELRLTGSVTANSGTPFTVRVFSKNQACQNVPGTNSERADQSGGSALANPTTLEWFNTAAFSIPTACFGNSSRNSVVGPGTFGVNAGFAKSIFFGRDGMRRLDFTWNTTNVLNHPNYSGLSTVLGSRTFGQITGVGAMRAMTFTTRMNF